MANNWASVEFKHLRALGAVATAGTFWAAAQALNTSQSSVSDYIATLETLTGQRLIERSRGKRTVELTEAGRLLLGHAAAIEARLRAAEADFRSLAAGQSGTLRVGTYQSVANKLPPAGRYTGRRAHGRRGARRIGGAWRVGPQLRGSTGA